MRQKPFLPSRYCNPSTIEIQSVHEKYNVSVCNRFAILNDCSKGDVINNSNSALKNVTNGKQNRPLKKSFKSKVVNGGGNITYPRECLACKNTYRSKSAFQYHKKKCGQIKNKITYPRQCVECKNTFQNQYYYFEHYKHSNCNSDVGNAKRSVKKSLYPRKCLSCDGVYRSKELFYYHKRNCVPSKNDITLKLSIKCHVCDKVFPSHLEFYRHRPHCSINDERYKYNVCPITNCIKSFSKISNLNKHLLVDHKSGSLKKITFDSQLRFKAWFDAESKSTFTSFKKSNGKKISGDKTYYYYTCQFNCPHATNVHNPHSLRRNKKGTIPKDIHCPVKISVCEDRGSVTIYYFPEHNHHVGFEN